MWTSPAEITINGFLRILRSGAYQKPWVLGATVILSTLVLFVGELHSRYQSTIASAELSAQRFAILLAEHTARTFEAVHLTLEAVKSIRDDDLQGLYPSPAAADQALRSLQSNSPVLVSVGSTNAAGDIVARSDYDNPLPRNVADWQHFTVQHDGIANGLYISRPFYSEVKGRWLSAVSLPLRNSDGNFAGIAAAMLDQSYFARIYRSVDLGRHGAVTLLRSDGTILTREPFVEGVIGESFSKTGYLSSRLPKSDFGTFELVSPVDQVSRLAAYKVVPGLPLIVLVSYDRAEALAPWYDHIRAFAPFVAALMIVILIGTWVLSRRTDELAKQAALFEATLDNMHEGLIVVGRDDRVAIWNRRAIELLDLSPEFLTAGPRSSELIAYQSERGEFEQAPPDVLKVILPRVSGESPNVYQRTRPNGRMIEVRTVPFSEGGVVRTYRDITVQKRDERELKESEARYRLLADNSTDMVFELDLTFTRRYVSPACQ
ncbi:MAG: PAS-domain containing protein, partial [Bradyrhizobium sp.]|nr:PAS-domain containing protein [Bradyrhizobium sp.]